MRQVVVLHLMNFSTDLPTHVFFDALQPNKNTASRLFIPLFIIILESNLLFGLYSNSLLIKVELLIANTTMIQLLVSNHNSKSM